MRLATILSLMFLPAWAQVEKPAASAAAGAVTVEGPKFARQTISELEKSFDGQLSRIGGTDPIDLLGLTRGLFLNDYGAVFTTDVSLIVTPSITPFRLVISDQLKAQVHQRKLDHLPLLQKAMREMVKNTAMTFAATSDRMKLLPPGAQFVLAVRILYLPWENTTGLPGQIIMKADLKGALEGKIQEEVQKVAATPAEFAREEGKPGGLSYLRLGEILLERKKIEAEDLERALELQRERGDKLGKILVDMGLIAQRDVLAALSDQLGIPLVTVDGAPPSAPEIDGLSHRFLRNCRAFPTALVDSTLTVAMADPLDFETIAALRSFSGLQIQTVLAAEQEILDSIEKYFGESDRQVLGGGEGEDEQATADLEHLLDMASEAPVIRLVNSMIADALEKQASDIHIEPFEKEFRVRFRVDGVLFNQEAPPRELKAAIISRLKLMAKLNIAERRLPQDGRIKIKILGREVDLRVSTLPTLYGESVVMRLLDRSTGDFYDLRRLGFDDHMLARMEHFTSLPHGIFLVTGPTGSGKSTTLYSALKRINLPDKKIITIEDPVEYQMDGINQIHVNPQIGLTFAAGLRHIVRQDPDVIMVGEIRDRETADIAIRAALTGHLVFSTLHTNDAPSAITRLTDMGVENYLITSSLVAVLAQRLVRVICKHCVEPAGTALSPEGEMVATYRGAGCPECHGRGYSSRMGIFEMMDLTDDIRKLIMANEDASVLTRAARRNGMRNLREDGWRKIRDGVSTVDEVMRVTQEF